MYSSNSAPGSSRSNATTLIEAGRGRRPHRRGCQGHRRLTRRAGRKVIPVHPYAGRLLKIWHDEGWLEYKARAPTADDFIVPGVDGSSSRTGSSSRSSTRTSTSSGSLARGREARRAETVGEQSRSDLNDLGGTEPKPAPGLIGG